MKNIKFIILVLIVGVILAIFISIYYQPPVLKPAPEIPTSSLIPSPEPIAQGVQTLKSKLRTQQPVKKIIQNDIVTLNNKRLNISWILNNTLVPQCNIQPDFVKACFSDVSNTIFISQDINGAGGVQKDFILYHEIGHFLFGQNFPKDIFKAGLTSPDYETIADNFAWWIYGQKYSSEKSFSDAVVSKVKRDYFSQNCNSVCVSSILNIKII